MELESPDISENRTRLPTGPGGMLICSKLGQKLSEMEVGTFVRIQRVIWEHLPVLRLKLSSRKLYFSFRAEQLAKHNYELKLIMQSALFFSFVLVSSPPRSFFRLNHVRKVRKRCPVQGLAFRQ